MIRWLGFPSPSPDLITSELSITFHITTGRLTSRVRKLQELSKIFVNKLIMQKTIITEIDAGGK